MTPSSSTSASQQPQPTAPNQTGELAPLYEASRALESKELAKAGTGRLKATKTALFIAFVVTTLITAWTLLLLKSVHLEESAEGSGFLYNLAGALWLIAAVHAALLVHEGGHAFAASLVGWQIQLVVAGALVFDRRENGRWRLRLGPLRVGGIMYSTARSWPGLEQFRRSFRTIVAGGPIGSVVGYLIGVATLVAVARATGTNPPRWAGFVEVGTLISLSLAILTLVPEQTKAGLYTDGAQLQRWRPFDASGVAHRARIPILAASHLSMQQRPREWDAEVVSLLESSTGDPEMGGVAAAFLAYRALDLGEVATAGQWLQHAINQQHVRSDETLNAAQAHIALAATIYEGAWRGDADAARRWIAISRSAKAKDLWLRQVAVASLHRANGKPWHLSRASQRIQAIQAASPIPVSALLLYTTIERLTPAQ